MSLWKRLLDTLIDPNIIVLLMSIGVLGITIEILNPGLILPGTVGAISLVIGLFGLQVLPVSWAGVLLMLARRRASSSPRRSYRATVRSRSPERISFVVGALMLFDPAGEGYQVSIWVALAVGGTLALVTAIVVTKVIRARRAPDEDWQGGDGRRGGRRPERGRPHRPRQRPRRDLEGPHRRGADRRRANTCGWTKSATTSCSRSRQAEEPAALSASLVGCARPAAKGAR